MGPTEETRGENDLLEIDILISGKASIKQTEPMCDSETDVFTHIPGPIDEPAPLRTKNVRGEGAKKRSKDAVSAKASAILGKKNEKKKKKKTPLAALRKIR